MPFLDTTERRAAALVLLLGLGLAIALAPFATGLIGIPVLYVIVGPLHRLLARRLTPRIAALAVTSVALVLLVVPGISLAGLIVSQAQQKAAGVVESPILARLAELRIGRLAVGPQLVRLGGSMVAWLGTNAFGFIGTAAHLALNLVIALFGLFYYLLQRPDATWAAVRPYIPFSTASTEVLRTRFRDVTASTLIGTGVTAALQGTLVALAFVAIGLPNAAFWGVTTAIFAVLPVVGSGLVWGPAALTLALGGRTGAAVGLLVWGVVLVANVDNVTRPLVFSRWARIHPLVTLVGAVAGVRYFGLLGLLIGPLALSCFFELIRMYHEEHLRGASPERPPRPDPLPPAP